MLLYLELKIQQMFDTKHHLGGNTLIKLKSACIRRYGCLYVNMLHIASNHRSGPVLLEGRVFAFSSYVPVCVRMSKLYILCHF